MSMHCDQCQESIKGGCNVRGVCGKDELTAKLQDTLIYAAEGIALCAEGFEGKIDRKYGQFISECLFVTVTNTNFDDVAIVEQIRKALAMRDEVRALAGTTPAHDAANWSGSTKEEFLAKAAACSIDSLSADPDLARSRASSCMASRALPPTLTTPQCLAITTTTSTLSTSKACPR